VEDARLTGQVYRIAILSCYDGVVAREEMTDDQYRRLLEFRSGLRRFMHWSEEQAGLVGVTPGQHQLLLAVRGHGDARGPTIGDIAHHLLLRHHSAVGLVDRAESAGLVERAPDTDDARVVRVRLTEAGRSRLASLTAAHFQELDRLMPRLARLWEGLAPGAPAA
jgi:DNA-binding MarR family transcriptional regulator